MGNNFWSIGLGVIDLNFLEFLSFGNNFFLIWLIFSLFYIKFFEKFFFSYNVFFFKFFNLFFFVNIFSCQYKFFIFNFGFYEYFSVIFPFFGIFISLSLNFLLLSVGNSEILGINFLLFFLGKQWGWDVYYFFLFGSLKFYSFYKIFENGFFFCGFSKEEFWSMNHQNFIFNFMVNSNFNKELEFGGLFFSISNLFFLSKDFNFEGVGNFVFILENFCNIFYVSSLDVIHSLGIPSLGIKLDVIPGFFSGSILEIQGGQLLDILEFSCYEFCGGNHSGMFGKFFILNIHYFFYFN